MENGVGWECLVSHESWVEYMQKIPEQAQAFNKKGHQHYMLLHNLFNQKAAATNSGQKHELDSVDSSESFKRVKDSVFSYEGPSLSVEAPSHSYSVTECINVLGLDHNFYVDAVSHLLKNVYHRVEFLATAEKYRLDAIDFRYINQLWGRSNMEWFAMVVVGALGGLFVSCVFGIMLYSYISSKHFQLIFMASWPQMYVQAQFVRAEKNVKELNLSVDLIKESRKLLERAALAEKDMTRGHTEIM
ncbi:hypothetical protein L1049_019089 [Liquidambar formosana]|uniref:Uncharacterized protein n=1 Tax=Liquidambar formosana TaxID=63359 RepID=A0AAP0RB08_LIQFO